MIENNEKQPLFIGNIRKRKSIESLKKTNRPENNTKKPKDKTLNRFGNHKNYYKQNYRSQDSRLSMLKRDHFHEKSVLDVGCHCGEFSLRIARKFDCKSLHGIDIDKELILNATNRVREEITIEKESGKTETKGFPYNLTFSASDFVNDYEPNIKYDVVLCLSVSKWVHFNNGDKGMLKLFEKVKNSLKIGGLFVFEPQIWKSYRKKLNSVFIEQYKAIKLRPNKFLDCLKTQFGFELIETLKPETSKNKGKLTTFEKRKIYILKL